MQSGLYYAISMVKQLNLVLVGAGGYGQIYLSGLLDPNNSDKMQDVRIAGVVDPFPERCRFLDKLHVMDVPLYGSLEEFYSKEHADLAVISSPIQYHAEQTCLALSRGSFVLCEKPLCATVQEAREIIEAERKFNKWVAVGYQWSFSDAIQLLKKDIASGLFGRALRLKTIVLWPRDEKYYKRNSWAGRRQDANGMWVLDSPVNNAVAHYLHNMFYLLGKAVNESQYPVSVTAELYRANQIENSHTGILRCYTNEGTEILFYSSHAVAGSLGPKFSFEFEKAIVTYEDGGSIVATFKNGVTKDYGNPNSDAHQKKLWDCIEAVRSGASVVCGPMAAAAHTLCVNGVQDSVPDILEFPQELVRIQGEPGERMTWVEGLDSLLADCFDKSVLPSEIGVSWSRVGKEIQLHSYKAYPGGF